MILSLVLAPGALYKELGEREAQEMEMKLKQGLRWGLEEGAPGCPAFCQEPLLGLELLFPGKSVVSPTPPVGPTV